MRARCLLLVVLPMLAALGCHNNSTQRAANAPPAPLAVPTNRFEAGNPVICRIVGRTKSLTIAATRLGPVYSVTGPAGQTLLSQGTLDDLRRQHPDLQTGPHHHQGLRQRRPRHQSRQGRHRRRHRLRRRLERLR